MSAVCLQTEALPWEEATEDCLYLTLATPALLDGEVLQEASLPVMVIGNKLFLSMIYLIGVDPWR